jgi:hypothetical protein
MSDRENVNPGGNSFSPRSPAFRRLAQRIRVPVGFLMAPLLLIAARPTPASLACGSIISILGLGIRAWASGHLKKNQELTTTGPYAHTRNPLYFGTFLLGTGAAISSGALWFAALFITLYLLIYVPVMFAEAETISKLFPGDYERYSRNVPLFLPRFSPYRDQTPAETMSQPFSAETKTGGGFSPSLYLRYREYRAAIGLAAVYALLAAKLWLTS